jgi:endonuclease G
MIRRRSRFSQPEEFGVRRLIATVALALLPLAASAAPTACPGHFVGGTAPDLTNSRLASKAREICYSGYAVLHSGVTRTPLWAAEHLTRSDVEAAAGFERRSTFHAEPALPTDERARLTDYERSGYDRGHMTPSEDMSDPQAQYESFSLANIVPQDPHLNRYLWAGIERLVRGLARERGELYVITGPVFQGETLAALNGRVLVPTGVFKAVHDPGRGQAGAYLAPNISGGEWKLVSLLELQETTGIDLFPGLPVAVKERPMDLPSPSK